MEKQLLEMMRKASSDEVVVSQRLIDDMKLLVYPLQQKQGVIIGVGYGRENAHLVNMDTVLQRRTKDLARFGAWLPAVFSDGSRFVVMRVERDEPNESVAADLINDIHIAQELLS